MAQDVSYDVVGRHRQSPWKAIEVDEAWQIIDGHIVATCATKDVHISDIKPGTCCSLLSFDHKRFYPSLS